MAQLQLKGKVFYMPGTWGPAVPVQGATVKIIDIDQPGKGDDQIWTGTTDANGNFQGTSSEWQDSTTNRLWVPDWRGGHWETFTVPDITDILVLQARVSQGGHETVLPFVFIGNNIESPPLIVAWGPPPRVLGKVNGVECTSVTAMNDKLKTAIQANSTPITIEVYGLEATALRPLAQAPDQLRTWVRQRLNLPAGAYNPWGGDDVFWVLVGVAIIILAVGASALMIAIGIAIIIAVLKGYKNVNVEQCINVPAGAGDCVKLILAR